MGVDAQHRTLVGFCRSLAEQLRPDSVVFAITEVQWQREETKMGRGLLLWLLGVPIPVILLLWLFFGR